MTTPVLSELVLSGVEVNKRLLALPSINLVSACLSGWQVLSSPIRGDRRGAFILCTLYFALTTQNSFAQNLGVNATGVTPNASSIIDLNTGNTFTSPNGKGLLPPNVALTSITDVVTVTSPATSLLVYNTATAGIGTVAVVPGYYYFNGSNWVAFGGADWHTTGNVATTAGTNFLGTTDAQDVVIKTNSSEQMRVASATSNVGIGTATPNTSAKLDVTSVTQGFAMPRMTSVQRKAIATPIAGLQVYDTNLKGYYTYDGTKWDCVTTPAGTVNYFANVTSPNGYLICNGQAVNRITYAELFAAIGTLYGVGDGSTTFNVPELRGEFIRGADNGRGVDAGRVLGTIQAFSTNLPVPMGLDAWGFSPNGAENNGPQHITSSDDYFGIANPSMNLLNPVETRPRNIALMPCIKF